MSFYATEYQEMVKFVYPYTTSIILPDSDGSNTLSQWVQIIKNKISGFNYINIDEIKYKNIRFYLQIWWILKNEGCKCTPSNGGRSANASRYGAPACFTCNPWGKLA